MISLKNKGVLVTGVRRRLGETIVQRLAAEGANIAIAYRSSRAQAEALVDTVSHKVSRVCLVQGDLVIESDVKAIVRSAAEQLGGLDFVVNMASDYEQIAFAGLDDGAWERGMTTAKGSYLLAVHAAKELAKNAGPTRGQIIFFGDWAAAETPYAGYLPYLTAKAAVHFMTRAFAVELAPQGILVNCVAPGPTQRPAELSESVWSAVLRKAPLQRESSAEDIAEVVVTLLKSETITGEIIRVDSGRHLSGP